MHHPDPQVYEQQAPRSQAIREYPGRLWMFEAAVRAAFGCSWSTVARAVEHQSVLLLQAPVCPKAALSRFIGLTGD